MSTEQFIDLFEMANVDPTDSGLRHRLFFSWKEYAGTDLQHGPRFKVEIEKGNFANVNLNNPQCPNGMAASDFKTVLHFIQLNQQTILKFWNKELKDPEFHAALQPVK